MRILKRTILRLLAAAFLIGSSAPVFATGAAVSDAPQPVIIDHTMDKITEIPRYWIQKAKDTLHIAYGHTSHGAQLTEGMKGLVAFANNGGQGLSMPTDFYAFSNGDTSGVKLDLEEGAGNYDNGWMVLDAGYFNNMGSFTGNSYPPRIVNWEEETREYLEDPSHADVNVVMWAWSGQIEFKYPDKLDEDYIAPVQRLEEDYPDITFVYMNMNTPRHDDSASAPPDDPYNYGRITAGNQAVRDAFLADPHPNKAFYDFEDIESHNPDNVRFQFPSENCEYYSLIDDTTPDGNWALEWQASHTEGLDWYELAEKNHTQSLEENQKAYAAWWLFARLAGWDGTPNRAPAAGDQSVSTPAGTPLTITLTASDQDNDPLVYFITPPQHGTLSGTAPDLTYTPEAGYTGPDSFTFEVSDGTPARGQGAIGITVGSGVLQGDANGDSLINGDDITLAEDIIFEQASATPGADANGDGAVDALDITRIEMLMQ
jgi:hypothetical protein